MNVHYTYILYELAALRRHVWQYMRLLIRRDKAVLTVSTSVTTSYVKTHSANVFSANRQNFWFARANAIRSSA
jgi:hypothetical protein